MIIRRILASFFIFLFVVVSLPTFFVYSLSKTFFNGEFYSGKVSDVSYNYLIDTVSENFYNNDSTIQRHFQEQDIYNALHEVFTAELFRTIMVDVGKQVEQLKVKPTVPVTLSFKIFRDSLLTISNNLAYNIFETLPTCQRNQLPEVNEEGIATCIPASVDYVTVAGPLSKQFEKAVYTAFPEQIQVDLNSTPTENKNLLVAIFSGIDNTKLYLLGSLLLLTIIIGFLVADSFTVFLKYEGVAFALAGIFGFISSLAFQFIPALVLRNYQQQQDSFSSFLGTKEHFQIFLNQIFAFPINETQKISFIFFFLGLALVILSLMLKRTFRISKT